MSCKLKNARTFCSLPPENLNTLFSGDPKAYLKALSKYLRVKR